MQATVWQRRERYGSAHGGPDQAQEQAREQVPEQATVPAALSSFESMSILPAGQTDTQEQAMQMLQR